MITKDQITLQHEKEYWDKVGWEAPLVAIAKCEEAAKQLITINSLTTAVYSGIVSFNDIIKQPLSFRLGFIFLITPLPLWLISLFLATRVIIPRTYTVNQIREEYVRISQLKYRFLQWSYFFLMLSMIAIIIVVTFYLLCLPPPPI